MGKNRSDLLSDIRQATLILHFLYRKCLLDYRVLLKCKLRLLLCDLNGVSGGDLLVMWSDSLWKSARFYIAQF